MKKYILAIILLVFVSKTFADNYNLQYYDNYDIKSGEEKTLFILDFSNSMNEFLHNERKIDVMLKTMREILPKINPQNRVGMRAYGYRMGLTPYDSCKASKLMIPIEKGGSALISKQIEKTRAMGMTPITYSLKQALYKDLLNYQGKKHIILLTDGGENCDESPCTFIVREIKNQPNLKIDVIAYDVREGDDISQLQCVALVTRGQFYTAKTAGELADSLNQSLSISKEVDAKIIPR